MALASPLKVDPTRTITLRRSFRAELRRVFNEFRKDLYNLLVVEDAFGLILPDPMLNQEWEEPIENRRWAYQSQDEAVENFDKWLDERVARGFMSRAESERWRKFIQRGFEKGANRAFDDTAKTRAALRRRDLSPRSQGFVEGEREQFVRTALSRSVGAEKLRLLQVRGLSELKGMSRDLRTRAKRALTDGLVRGLSPREIAGKLSAELDISFTRAETIAYTELVRAHAEGQLNALEQLGVEEVGVAVEWSTASGACPLCKPLEGIVLKLSEARGMLPRHPRCRCAWVPANLGEAVKGQVRSQARIKAALKRSVKADTSKGSDWGPDRAIGKKRPVAVFNHSATCDCCEPLRKFGELMGSLEGGGDK